MVLYTCAFGTDFGSFGHACGRAGKALKAAGYDFEVKKVGGFKHVPFTIRGEARKRVEELSGQQDVPILDLGDDGVVTGSEEIVRWAEAHPT